MSTATRRYGVIVALAVASGILAGAGGWLFLVVLDAVTELHATQQWLVLGLPVAGFLTIHVVQRVSAESAHGNSLVFERLARVDGGVPATLAPIVVIGTWVTHLFGGSAGREGTALQMSASLSDAMSRRLGVSERDRRMLLAVSLAAGFGAVFGTPLAGAVFAIEANTRWRMRWSVLVPALVAAFVGDSVVALLGYRNPDLPSVSLGVDPSTLAACIVLGLGTGIVATVYVWLTRCIRSVLARGIEGGQWRAAVGGVAIVLLTAAFGAEFLGLSLGISDRALSGEALNSSYFILKLVFTAVTAGSGFIGGEVTPLFVMGAAFGSASAAVLGLSVVAASALGFVAVFGAAAHVPLTCAVMAMELFGMDLAPNAFLVCLVASFIARHPGLHGSSSGNLPGSRGTTRR
jgi:H+/Cl- antiporter ClcA